MKTTIILAGACAALAVALTAKAQTGTVTRTFGDGGLPAILAVHDLNGDGVLSQEEREAMAAARQERHEYWVREWDTNSDGVITGPERDAARSNLQQRVELTREERFVQADTNRDGYLSFDEFSAIPAVKRLAQEHPDAPKAIFNGMDANHDGLVSLEEFMLQLRRHDRPPLDVVFRTADTNADGYLSFAEFSAIPAIVELAKRSPNAPQQLFTKMDTNTDGQLSLAEFLAQPICPDGEPPQDPFALADTDHDGFLSFAEFSAMPAMVELAKMNPGAPQQVFNRLDTNLDQLLSPVEFVLMPPDRKSVV